MADLSALLEVVWFERWSGGPLALSEVTWLYRWWAVLLAFLWVPGVHVLARWLGEKGGKDLAEDAIPNMGMAFVLWVPVWSVLNIWAWAMDGLPPTVMKFGFYSVYGAAAMSTWIALLSTVVRLLPKESPEKTRRILAQQQERSRIRKEMQQRKRLLKIQQMQGDDALLKAALVEEGEMFSAAAERIYSDSVIAALVEKRAADENVDLYPLLLKLPNESLLALRKEKFQLKAKVARILLRRGVAAKCSTCGGAGGRDESYTYEDPSGHDSGHDGQRIDHWVSCKACGGNQVVLHDSVEVRE